MVEWPTCRKDCQDTSYHASRDKGKSNVNGYAVASTKTILLVPISQSGFPGKDFSESYRKADVECEHREFDEPDKQHISCPPRDLNFRANRPIQIVSTAPKIT